VEATTRLNASLDADLIHPSPRTNGDARTTEDSADEGNPENDPSKGGHSGSSRM